MREVAASSVDEARSLGEQLMAALADNRQLAAALSDLRAGKDLLDTELEDAEPAAAASPTPVASDASTKPTDESLPRLTAVDGGPQPAAGGTVLARLETGGDTLPERAAHPSAASRQ